jgi:hypothetical protein
MVFNFELKLDLEFGKALEICTRRFRRNLDMGIFPKMFYAPQGFLENEICHAMICNLRQNYLEKILPYTICSKMQHNALLIWQNLIFTKSRCYTTTREDHGRRSRWRRRARGI